LPIKHEEGQRGRGGDREGGEGTEIGGRGDVR
jgi:hypothetical protein